MLDTSGCDLVELGIHLLQEIGGNQIVDDDQLGLQIGAHFRQSEAVFRRSRPCTLAANKIAGSLDPHELPISQMPVPVGWYLRLTVKDRPGILARVAEVVAHEGINIEAVIQERSPKDRLSFVITVEPVSETVMGRALEAINRFDFMREPVLLMRVEQSLVKNA